MNDCSARANGTPCTDLNECTNPDSCDGEGLCTSGDLRECGDGQDFTRDLCDAAIGCVYREGCWGDCDGDSSVMVNELVTVVQVALGSAGPSECSAGIPPTVEVDIVVALRAVYNALDACPL